MNTIEQAEARAEAMRASWRGDTAVTPRGVAVSYIARLKHHIPALDAADRDVVRELLAELMAELDAAAWDSFAGALASSR